MPGLRRQECVGDSVCALVVAECAKAILCRITYIRKEHCIRKLSIVVVFLLPVHQHRSAFCHSVYRRF